ncbi:carbon storage regulator [Paenibacillus sp. FSL H8-0548]|uniref:carbon storage regulator CsrA n=1 Tax=Paenibacillus sp. FSL H8-0548 TaxID=1920422 RepID=UPI00096C2469|nr:carbon storage regulator CsrA [Paenibacillus sp. FSL H8-0548]OMF35833.1 carbon storage regulator [Paenibacillus sp. FSL H8-0548]
MLVLSRKQNESIIIDGDIEVVVLGVEGDTVKLGIRAPKEIDIYRKELYDSIISSNQEAAHNAGSLDQIARLLQSGRITKT